MTDLLIWYQHAMVLIGNAIFQRRDHLKVRTVYCLRDRALFEKPSGNSALPNWVLMTGNALIVS
ncbi:MAG: hypothetical protein ACSHXH_06060 [Marivita sp.]|uniref:hypothetical protein n=1 Tax=Marivita sp. TaxID=2003365 RepID=UPI003EFA2E9C